jgi:hypothetical protein
MFKKVSIPLILAIVASLILNSSAFAQGGQPPRGGRRGIGKIISLQGDQISIQPRQGEPHVIRVDDKTQYRTSDGQVISFGALQVGQWVAGILRFDDQGQLVARLVVTLPDDYDPTERLGRRAGGRVTGVDVQGGTFTLHTLSGEDLTFRVAEGTLFAGGVQSFADLQAGMQAAVGAIRQSDGSLLALVVLARSPLHWHAGRILSVDVAAGQFTLQSRRGEVLLFHVDGDTRFHSRGAEVDGLEDLREGMRLWVGADVLEQGGYLARQVLVGRQPLR